MLACCAALILGCSKEEEAFVQTNDSSAEIGFRAPKPKVDVCHYASGSNSWHVISISENALPAHLAHGDVLLVDNDGDGVIVASACTPNGDCDDNDASVYPGAEELCDDGVDNNCDGQVDEGCPVPPTVTAGYSWLGEAAGVRIRGNSSGNEIYLGVTNLAVGSNRVEASYPDAYSNWQDGTYQVTFSYAAGDNKIVFTIDDGAGDSKTVEYDFDLLLAPGCPVAGWNTMDINVVDRLTNGELAFNNVVLDGFPLGNFDDEGWKNWTVSGYDFSGGFALSGDLVVSGWTGSETNKLQIMVGCL